MIEVDVFGGQLVAYSTGGCNVEALDALELKSGGSRWFGAGCKNSSLVETCRFVELYVVFCEKRRNCNLVTCYFFFNLLP